MKKLICFEAFCVLFVALLVLLSLMLGCATTTYTETKPDGTKIDVSIKRPIFAASAVAWSTNSGNINSASSVDLNQLVGSMLAGYLAAQAIPASTVVK